MTPSNLRICAAMSELCRSRGLVIQLVQRVRGDVQQDWRQATPPKAARSPQLHGPCMCGCASGEGPDEPRMLSALEPSLLTRLFQGQNLWILLPIVISHHITREPFSVAKLHPLLQSPQRCLRHWPKVSTDNSTYACCCGVPSIFNVISLVAYPSTVYCTFLCQPACRHRPALRISARQHSNPAAPS